jgi:hypothetical protein
MKSRLQTATGNDFKPLPITLGLEPAVLDRQAREQEFSQGTMDGKFTVDHLCPTSRAGANHADHICFPCTEQLYRSGGRLGLRSGFMDFQADHLGE